ncbi:MAG TPA: nucleotidyltransferase domain-containing protein [Desulfobacteraceae bacterium]|nr:nucleotidyltransferase domain-containing protein [Desulfobacteraceae bacterium]
MKHTISETSRKHLSATVAARLAELSDKILAAYVFGSFIEGKPYSDMDLGLLMLNDPPNPVVFEIEIETELEKITGCPVDIRILNGAPLSFCQQVIRNGEVILDSDPDTRADFEGRTLKKYFDFSRFRTRYLREVCHAPL